MYHEKAGGKWVFMCGAMPWRCKRKKQRISWERMLMSFAYVGSLIMYSYRFNCKPHMCTHTQTWRRENFQKSSVLKFSGKSFSDDSSERQHQHSRTAFNDAFPCAMILSHWKMFWWKNHVFDSHLTPHVHSIRFFFQPFYDENFITHRHMPYGVWWISSGFIKIFN